MIVPAVKTLLVEPCRTGEVALGKRDFSQVGQGEIRPVEFANSSEVNQRLFEQ